MLLVPHVADEDLPDILSSAVAYGMTVPQMRSSYDSQNKGGKRKASWSIKNDQHSHRCFSSTQNTEKGVK